MANWREDYIAALTARDEQEQANSSLYDAYTRLADHAATNTTVNNSQQATTAGNPISPRVGGGQTTSAQQGASGANTDAGAVSQGSLVADLAAAQRSRAELQDQLTRTTAELDKLKSKTQQDTRKINSLDGERTHLTLRLKDRDEELRGKAKLLDSVQDELASLNLQLNMAEERSSKLQRENQELIDRWMARMGKEADAMNDASRF